METVIIEKSWHKSDAPIALTYKQLEYINALRTQENCEWPFVSQGNAMRSLTKHDGSTIINTLKNGDKIIFK